MRQLNANEIAGLIIILLLASLVAIVIGIFASWLGWPITLAFVVGAIFGAWARGR